MPSCPIYLLNAFASKLFAGNPACVCVLPEWIPDSLLRLIAIENAQPATAFLVRQDNNTYDVRWFSPEYEIDLCGHGTLASAYVIFKILEPTWTDAELNHASGTLRIKRNNDLFTLDFPAKTLELVEVSPTLIQGLGAKPIKVYQYKAERCLAIFETEEEVRQLKPDMQALRQLSHRGFIVSARGNQTDFVSRTFYPRKVVSEDAITGSSHCLLIPYWSKKLNKTKLLAYQASQRGGELICEDRGDRVWISGKVVKYMQGEIFI